MATWTDGTLSRGQPAQVFASFFIHSSLSCIFHINRRHVGAYLLFPVGLCLLTNSVFAQLASGYVRLTPIYILIARPMNHVE